MEFQYHDPNYEFYYTESVENGLPPWRGGLYNFTMFYKNPGDKESLNNKAIEDFITEYDPMIRPKQMLHILERHSVYGRINDVLIGNGNDKISRRKIITEKLGITGDFNDTIYDIKQKLLSRNKTGLDYDDKLKLSNLALPKLTDFELEFGSEFDQIDFIVDKKTGKKEYVDHYPIKMTNLHIMEAIREAYKSAHRAGNLKIQFDTKDDSSLPAPDKGKRLYEGYSSKYNLIIQFWYNFDLNIIETAYPVTSDRSKKH